MCGTRRKLSNLRRLAMQITEQVLNGEKFYQAKDFLDANTKEDFIQDIEHELETNLGPTPLYQTNHYLQNLPTGKKEHWQAFYKKTLETAESITGKKFRIDKSWANKITEESEFYLHTHPSDMAVVYYLHTIHPSYGTYVKMDDKELILLGIENSVLFFNGKIEHEIVFPPVEVIKHSPRYSLALDLYYD